MIQKVKEFFPSIDPNFLTLIDLDSQSFIEEVLSGNLYTFIKPTRTALEVRLEKVASDLLAIDNPPLECTRVPSSERDKGPSHSFAKPPRAPRSKRREKIDVFFLFPLLMQSKRFY